MYNLGNMYANGHGVPKDTLKAMDFYMPNRLPVGMR